MSDFIVAFCLILICIGTALLVRHAYNENADCTAHGGVYVRSFFGFTCIRETTNER